MKFSVTQKGKPLSKSKYTWDEKTCIFSTMEDNLVLDFSNYSHCTFNTGWGCTFTTGWNCTFTTDSHCTFNTGSSCTFNTGRSCTFKTDWSCTFTCGEKCVVVRRDVYEIIEVPVGVKIILNGNGIKGISNKEEVMEALL